MSESTGGPESKAQRSAGLAAWLLSSDYFLYLSPSLVQACASMIMVPVTTHYLNPRDFGVFAIIIAITLPVKAFVASGARWVIGGNYFKAEVEDRRSMLFNVAAFEFLLRLSAVALFYALGEQILSWLVPEYSASHVRYLNIVLMAALANTLWHSVSFLMTLQKHPKHFAGLSILQVVVNMVTTVVCLVVLDMGVESLFVAMFASSVVSLIFELYYMRKNVAFRFDGRWLREVVRTGLRATPGGIAELISNMADKIFIQRWVGLGALGLYSHSLQYQSVFKMLTNALSNTMNSHVLQTYSGDLPTTRLERMLSAWYGALGVVGIGIALFTDNVVSVLTHGKFVGAASLVLIWYVGVFGVSHSIPYSTFLMARKHNRVLMYSQTVPTILGIALVGAAAYRFGAHGAAWGLVTISFMIQLWRSMAAHRLGYRPIAERRFILMLALYVGIWILDYTMSWSFLVELVVAAALMPLVAVRVRLLSELKWAFLSREQQPVPPQGAAE